MERVLCSHGVPCILKTGLSKGMSHGKSFYMCAFQHDSCGFVKQIDVEPMVCPKHNALVGMRKWAREDRISYYCSMRNSKGYCGTTTVANQEEKENVAPESEPREKQGPGVLPELNIETPFVTKEMVGVASSATGGERTGEKESGRKRSCSGKSFNLHLSLATDDSSSEESISSEEDEDDSCVILGTEESTDTEQSPNPSEGGSKAGKRSPKIQIHANISDDAPPSTAEDVDSSVGEDFYSGTSELEGSIGERLPRDNQPLDDSRTEAVEDDSRSEDSETDNVNSSRDSGSFTSSDAAYHSISDSCQAIQPDVPLSPHDSGHSTSDSPTSVSIEHNTSNTSSTLPEQTSLNSPEMDVESSPHSRDATDVGSTSPKSECSVTDSNPSQKSNPASPCEVTEPQSLKPVYEPDVHMHEASERESPQNLVVIPGASISEDEGTQTANQHSTQPVDTSDLEIVSSPKTGCSTSDTDTLTLDPLHRGNVQTRPTTQPVSVSQDIPDHPTVIVDSDPRPVVIMSDEDPPLLSGRDQGATDDGPTHNKQRETKEPEFKLGYQYRKLEEQYKTTEHLISTMSDKLPDGGASLKKRRDVILARIAQLKRPVPTVDLTTGEAPSKLYSKGGLTYQAKMLTTGAVEHLHTSLASCPTEQTLAEDPPGLTVPLMVHQRRALAWLEWREKQTPSGGILADDMGLGKTLSMLSLIMKQTQTDRDWHSRPPATQGLVCSSGTLVVCPASLMLQWEGEVKSKLRPGRLSVKVYHGPSRTKSAHELSRYDVVVTTYNIVNVEGAACEEPNSDVPHHPRRRMAASTTLFQVHWRRVVLDEAHVIRNPKSGTSIGVCMLKSDHRWALTGTPIQNKLKDFYSLIKFIRLAPFDDFRVWMDTVEKKGTLGKQRLNTMVSSLVLRRTKEELGADILKLTKRNVEIHSIVLRPEEREVYSVLFKEAKKVFVTFLQEQGENPHTNGPQDTPDGLREAWNSLPPAVARVVRAVLAPVMASLSFSNKKKGQAVLSLLLRLRQCCSHLHLLTSALKNLESDQDELELELAMGALRLEEDGASRMDEIPERFAQEKTSTKLKEVLQLVREITARKDSPPQKCVVVSQWTSMLDMAQYHLGLAGISCVRIDGSVPPKARNGLVIQFNAPSKFPSVMLLSLQAGGVGLNLTGGNHVFILDMHWNPALEEQAADRCHRVGQTRDVFIHRFVCKGTVEERIQLLQQLKLQLSRDVLSGASERSRVQNKLSLNDLKHLFEISG